MIINKKIIDKILDNPDLENHIKTYLEINNSKTALKRSDLFCKFYKLRPGTTKLSKEDFEIFKKAYFGILDKYNTKPNTEFKVILQEVDSARNKLKNENENDRKEISFSSKLLHTINNKKPIWDKHLISLYNFNLNNDHKDWTEDDCCSAYKEYCDKYKDFMSTDIANYIIEKFNEKYSKYKDQIIDIKKVDFVLWLNRRPSDD